MEPSDPAATRGRTLPAGPSGDPTTPGSPFPHRQNEPANANQEQIGNRRLGDHRRARCRGRAGKDRADCVRIIGHVVVHQWQAERPDISWEPPVAAPVDLRQIDQHGDIGLQRLDRTRVFGRRQAISLTKKMRGQRVSLTRKNGLRWRSRSVLRKSNMDLSTRLKEDPFRCRNWPERSRERPRRRQNHFGEFGRIADSTASDPQEKPRRLPCSGHRSCPRKTRLAASRSICPARFP